MRATPGCYVSPGWKNFCKSAIGLPTVDVFESKYETGAKLMKWDRAALERQTDGPAR